MTENVENDQKAANNNKMTSEQEGTKALKVQQQTNVTQPEVSMVNNFEMTSPQSMPALVDVFDSKRNSADVSSISSGSTEDTVIQVAVETVAQEAGPEFMFDEHVPNSQEEPLTDEEEPLTGVQEIKAEEISVLANEGESSGAEVSEVKGESAVNGVDHFPEEVRGEDVYRQKIKSANDEVNRWMENSSKMDEEARSIDQGSEDMKDQGSEDMKDQGSEDMKDQGSNDEVSAAIHFAFQNSMELSKQNPVLLSDDEDSLSFTSARSELTIASTSQDNQSDTQSFRSAPATPTNSSTFDFPLQRDSEVEYDIITTPVGSDDEVLNTPVVSAPVKIDAATPVNGSPPKYQIRVVDETPKQKSGSMDVLPSGATPSYHGNGDVGKLSSSPQRISHLSASSPQFGDLNNSQSRFGGSGSSIGKETSI